MERSRAPEQPRWALVFWPKHQSLGCIHLDAVPAAVGRDAVVIAREDWCLPVERPHVQHPVRLRIERKE